MIYKELQQGEYSYEIKNKRLFIKTQKTRESN